MLISFASDWAGQSERVLTSIKRFLIFTSVAAVGVLIANWPDLSAELHWLAVFPFVAGALAMLAMECIDRLTR
ncbi:MAG: hypothetical protein WCJ30_20415 [Deltaproteobacteria bacterium]